METTVPFINTVVLRTALCLNIQALHHFPAFSQISLLHKSFPMDFTGLDAACEHNVQINTLIFPCTLEIVLYPIRVVGGNVAEVVLTA